MPTTIYEEPANLEGLDGWFDTVADAVVKTFKGAAGAWTKKKPKKQQGPTAAETAAVQQRMAERRARVQAESQATQARIQVAQAQASQKKTLLIGGGVVAAVAIGGVIYYLATRKPPASARMGMQGLSGAYRCGSVRPGACRRRF